MTARVAVLGLGAMGLPMATHLARGHAVTGFDVSAERVALAGDAGAAGASTPAEACAGADVVLVGVRDAAQLATALFGEGGAAAALAAGTAVVLTSTVGVDAARAAADRLAAGGVHLVDAPVSGGPVRAGTGDLLIMVGGPGEALDRARPVLEALSSTLVVAGPRVGDGQLLKTVNQLLCGVHTAAAGEALALAHALGLDLDATIDVLGRGAAASFMLADRGPRMAQRLRGEEPPLRSRLDVISKDMGIVARLAHEAHVATPVAAAAEQLYRLAEGRGLAAADDSVVATTLGPAEGRA
ncbi:NAD(P)-dependent oxidoreductase [Cellulomonas marina]|uniref:3-hydroxyisobutyrate dehydrogenase n=1 Tax=Cellulomonas marina TaxID=988821 RepID=A0A1I0VBN9_9CELL|nr:NAD(P)-dependent oxidoreductase [Cellulomonas marina]GIG29158.1 beta-hydroxyacid dehydrogenase [Cellulomonas marina]SFA73751.1 3-hydroxyisobutyrate dehydrogenase [Cellulomonas marina]